MKKVLHVLSDTNIGGAGKYLINLISHWDHSKFEMIVACPGGGELEKQLNSMKIKVYPLKGGESSWKLSQVSDLVEIIKKQNVHVVHTHASFSGRVAGKLTGCKIIMTRHGLSRGNSGAVKRIIVNLLSKFFTHKIIAISRAVKINLIESGVPANMIKTIYNGIDLTVYRNSHPTLRKHLGVTSDIPIIGIVARLVWEKGYEYAIKAMPRVLEKFPKAILVIIGDGPQEKPLKKLCMDLDITDSVIFMGFQNNVENLAIDFDVFVLPSVSEGLGLALLEAMALEKPVITTEVGGIPEVVKNGINGLLVPPENEMLLAENIIKILTSEEMANSLAVQAKDTVYEKFSADNMASETMEVYEQILR
mgnify:CR=1 FL=1